MEIGMECPYMAHKSARLTPLARLLRFRPSGVRGSSRDCALTAVEQSD